MIIDFRYHEHEVDDDIVSCETVYEEKCEDVTQGYTTEEKCTKWPKEVCTQTTETVLKYSPETVCKKEPEELCGPSQCLLQPGPEQCFDKSETVITEVKKKTRSARSLRLNDDMLLFRSPKKLATWSLRNHANT